jgi:hypothetical protein
MREQFFYRREKLIDLINAEKTFPTIQIFSALNSLIDDDNELIIDKYERKGRLINIDDYYLFQPEELSNPNISLFDRTVPIDYKRAMIPIQFKPPAAQKRDSLSIEELPRGEDLTHIEENVKVFDALSKKGLNITREEKDKLMTHHTIESLNFEQKIKIMKALGGGLVGQYFEEKLVGNNYMLNDAFVCKFFDKTFNDFKEEEPLSFVRALKQKYNVRTFPFSLKKQNDKKVRQEAAVEFSKQFGDYVGFMAQKKESKGGSSGIVFKFKEHDEIFKSGTLGSTCTEGFTNEQRIAILNDVLNKLDKNAIPFAMDDVKGRGDKLNKDDLCLIMEFLLRLCELRKIDQKIWFLTPELALYFDLYRG